MRREFGSEFKAKVALAALRDDRTLSELSSHFGIHSIQISRWKKEAREGLSGIFSNGRKGKAHSNWEEWVEGLYKKIGELEVENDWLKKKLSL